MAKRAERTRNNGKWTEAQYWQAVRSALRSKFKFWNVAQQVLLESRRKYSGKNAKQKWEHQCHDCKQWFMRKEVQIHHVIPCGSLKCPEDIAGFLQRLTSEDKANYRVLCSKCHQTHTNADRN